MATTYDWNCRTVDCYPTDQSYTDVVYNVHWIVTGTSDTLDPDGNAYTATSIGTQTISTSDLSSFTPFADLTNADVVTWTKAAMGADQVTALEANIQSQIDLEITPTSVTLTIEDPVPPAEGE
jgi:hypothetical protein|tara:strand:+ start:645 stop:1013 length:369 start_codon:yes stop_codon:yes gene_type:complete